MSDIVLKDKSGVKNTYSDIETINIPDGKGGFVKYSLGGTHLPEYDGTVIIEKGESVLGLRRYIDLATAEPINDTPLEYASEATEDILAPYIYDIESIILTDGEVVPATQMTTLLSMNNATNTGTINIVMFKVEGNWMGILQSVLDTDYAVFIGMKYNVLSTANATVDEWLLANTEGVSV